MTRISTVCAAVLGVAAGCCSLSQGATIFSQSFDMASGTSTWGGTVASTGLSYPNLVVSGNRLQQNNYGNTTQSIGTSLTSGVWYTSYLLNVPTNGNTGTRIQLDGWTWGDDQWVMVGTNDNGGLFLQFAKTSSGTYQSADNVFTKGSTHLIVIKQDTTTGANTTVSVYLDPTPGAVEPVTATISAVDPNAKHYLRAVQLYNNAWNTTVSWDEVRVGNTFADVVPAAVVPEPASVALLGVAGLLLLPRRTKKA